MKNIICLLVSFTFLSSLLFSQQKDSLVQLYPGMGDTLDFVDREIFGLYPDVEGFDYAKIFARDSKFLVSEISYFNKGFSADTIIVEDFSKLSKMRAQLNQFAIQNDKKLESPINASIFTTNSNKYDGKLMMFSKKFLYLASDINYSVENHSPFYLKSSIESIDSLMIPEETNLFPYIGGGAFAGFLAGFLIGTSIFEDDMGANKEVKWMATGGFGALAGALLGWVIGAAIPNDYITIRFNSPYDVIKLKDYSAYYFRHDKSLKEKYEELK
ncbi:MAG: hypothetical protein OQK52_05430 [Ignavibacteriaceae bacterium]|jgi:hypothetical protein|nr:hypothetical protein [Ignavibacteriaceae bacterium]MCW8812141.1 hypothetical protein [Chlorobium sp.]MCW8996453.1 hypothetical protein [Psychromonas sp.]MCW8817298.1 hypothetical protein [Ignavibacteriaceae bacterium]MCW8824001.1 hypothetical protein [Ignavibacteriaceae bacterium]